MALLMFFCDDCEQCLFADEEEDSDYSYKCQINNRALDENEMRNNDKSLNCKNFKLRNCPENQRVIALYI